MAAEVLSGAGAALEVQLFDAMPSVGRKFLLAGKGGLNLTHSEGAEAFLGRYGERSAQIAPLLSAFGPDQLRAWAQDLGVETFVGSSGRVFPRDMKASGGCSTTNLTPPLTRFRFCANRCGLTGRRCRLCMRARWSARPF